jgi:molybdopterin molybdotransferase
MDGYAFIATDLLNKSTKLNVVGKAYAGHPYLNEVRSGECVRIMTGAAIPRGCDTVIAQELVSDATDTHISIAPSTVNAGDNRRLAGEDLRLGSVALRKGKRLSPADIGLLASLGIANIAVIRRPRVAFFSTGDELRSIGQALDEGCVYDSNRYTLHSMLVRAQCEPIDMGVVKDNPASLEKTLREACAQADVIITTGGVSAGDADYTRQMMARLGEVLFCKIAMRPGRPMAFGKIQCDGRTALLFGLPGNPVAVMATFYFLARDAIYELMGTKPHTQNLLKVASTHAIRKKPGRTEYQRAILSTDTSGTQHVTLTGAQGSGILSSMSEANCMVVLDHNQSDVAAGELVSVLAFDGFI